MSSHLEALQDYEFYCQGRLANPYPLLSRLREEDPVHWSESLDGWLITRYDDVLACINDPRLSSDRASAYMRALPEPQQRGLRPLGEHVSNWLGFTDPPKHTRMRKLVGKVFTPRLASGMLPRVGALVAELLDRVQPRGQMDIIRDLARPLPSTIICEILGIDADKQEQFKSWLDDLLAFVGGFGPLLSNVAEQAYRSQRELAAFFRELTLQRRRQPRNDMVSDLAAVEGESDGLSEEELLGLCVFLFAAGEETTVSLIGNSMLALLRNPDQLERLKNHPELVGSAIEEFLRYESPLQIMPRVARSDIEIKNRLIRAGQAVILSLGSANRDPAQFPDPDRLDIGRSNNRHLAFGWGIHFCLGAPLARVEAQGAINSMIERFPRLHLQNEEFKWRQNLTIRCLESLPVEF